MDPVISSGFKQMSGQLGNGRSSWDIGPCQIGSPVKYPSLIFGPVWVKMMMDEGNCSFRDSKQAA